MWKNCIENAQEYITLHDCVVNGAEAFDDALSLTFDDGFWMLADTKYNSCGETVRTDKSKINFTEFDEEDIEHFYRFLHQDKPSHQAHYSDSPKAEWQYEQFRYFLHYSKAPKMDVE